MIAAVAGPLVVCAVLIPFRDGFANANAALLLVLVVVAVAAAGLRSAGIVAALSSAVWFDLFLAPPYYRLTIDRRDDLEMTVLLVVIGAVVTQIAIWGRRQQARASRQKGYLDGVLTTSGAVAAGSSTAELIDQVGAQLIAVLRIDGCRFVPGSTPARGPLLNHDGSVTRGAHALKIERDGLPTNAEIELPIQYAGRTRGRFLLTASTRISRPDLEQRLVAVALAGQVGAALASPAELSAADHEQPTG
nr:DUF4118 domain-containing protein [Kribbella italica]